MAETQSTISARVLSLLPRWFGDAAPLRDALAQGVAWALLQANALILYAALQLRIRTATDGWLDMIAADFFGLGLPRGASTDASYRNRILIGLFRERTTRAATVRVLLDLTGRAPDIIEPERPLDCGGYGVACGYGAAGSWGEIGAYELFITARRPLAGSGYTATDADIFAAVEAVRPAGIEAWVRIIN